MKGNHLTGSEFLDRLYGIGREDSHLEECPACRSRWQSLQARRARLLAEPEVGTAFLARQRAAIVAKMEHRHAVPARFAPAFAAAVLVLVAVLLARPMRQPVAEIAARNDSQIFAEVYALIQQDVPRAGLPIQRLFEEQQ